MRVFIILLLAVLLTACFSGGIAKTKYVSTDSYQEQIFNACMTSKNYKQFTINTRKSLCNNSAKSAMQDARVYYRLNSTNTEHYDSCQKQFKNESKVEVCFKALQHKYYNIIVAAAKVVYNR